MNDPFGSKVFDLFPTAVITGRIPDWETLNAQLKDVIAARRASNPGINRSNVLGWHSTIDMLAWGGEPVHRLGQQACALCDRYSYDTVSPNTPRFGWMAEMWANVSPPNASNQMHAHPGALWSLVYYVDCGYDGDDPAQGGELVLHDPRFPMNRMYAPDMAFRWPDGRTEENYRAIRPRDGMIVGFPSWMKHSVQPYRGRRERISIAINLMIAFAPGNHDTNQAARG